MLYYGTADNNVHLEYDAAHRGAAAVGEELRGAGGPGPRHSGINTDRMMEFFIENLIIKPTSQTTPSQ